MAQFQKDIEGYDRFEAALKKRFLVAKSPEGQGIVPCNCPRHQRARSGAMEGIHNHAVAVRAAIRLV
nr:hypothetical protein [Candidatus Sigynarchaeota archaeon]